MEHDGTVDGRDAALVAAMLDAGHHAFENPARVQQTRRQFLLVERRGKAEDIGIEQQLPALPGAEGVTVDADDAG